MAAPATEMSHGYHPLPEAAADMLAAGRYAQALVVGGTVPDVIALVGELRMAIEQAVTLPRGVYWFRDDTQSRAMIVTHGATAMRPQFAAAEDVASCQPLVVALQWFEALWPKATTVPIPRFGLHQAVLTKPQRHDGLVTKRTCSSGSWNYSVTVSGRTMQYGEHNLEPLPMADDPSAWVAGEPVDSQRFAATLTRAKLGGELSDMVFSFRATRTLFKPYQFKPVMKMLATGKLRLLIADEVGLGKTVEAGLVWTELEARRRADSVLVLCPSSLVGKWKLEMETRFGFELQELDAEGLATLERRLEKGTLPPRAAYISSIERMRKWESLERVTNLGLGFDLIVVDEAHALRNSNSKSHLLGERLSEWAEALVFLSATPLNLHNSDVYNLVNLLVPGEFGDIGVFESQLEPTAVLNGIAHTLLDASVTNADRRRELATIPRLTFGLAVAGRPEYRMLHELLSTEALDAAGVVRARRLIMSLHTLSAVINRTRKVEVQDEKALRDAETVHVNWTHTERAFYDEFRSWCVERAKATGMPLHFAMQMPLRLAGSCVPAAARQVRDWPGALLVDEDDPDSETHASSSTHQIPPPRSLVQLAEQLENVDSKFDALLPRLEELVAREKRALLFTFSRPTLTYLWNRLRHRFRIALLHGDVPKATRQEIMADFRRGKYDLVLANRVASEGLDFEFCSTVINYDLPWNPMEVEQRIGRIDRIGQQEKKIYVLNFHTPDTIESNILERVMKRIGVFERSIGELEPIVREGIADLPRAVYDFELTPTERELRANQILAAIEERALARDEVESASAYLLSSDGVDIADLEADLVTRGRYVGPRELTLVIQDWLSVTGGGSRLSSDGTVLTVRGNAATARGVRALVSAKERSTQEIDELAAALVQELDIHLSLDQQKATTQHLNLLTANHPLVRAALRVPAHRQARFASVRVPEGDEGPAGTYLVYLGLARWSGLRPRNEIWHSAVDLATGMVAGPGVGDLLLARLADGRWEDAKVGIDSNIGWAVDVLEGSMSSRRDNEEAMRTEENNALLETRRLSIREIHDRNATRFRATMESPLVANDPRVLSMWGGKLRREGQRLAHLEGRIDEQAACGMSLEPLAMCLLEAFR